MGIDVTKFDGIEDDIAFTQLLLKEQSVFCLPAAVRASGRRHASDWGFLADATATVFMSTCPDIAIVITHACRADVARRAVPSVDRCVPCTQVFGTPNFFRIVTTVPQAMMAEALERTAEFCGAHRHNAAT